MTPVGEAEPNAEVEVEAEAQDEIARYTPRTQPRDAQGRFRDVLARLKMDLGEASLHRVAEKVEQAQNLDNVGNYAAAAKAAEEVISIVDRMDKGALNKDNLGNIQLGTKALAKAIANLPLPFKDQSQKIRFSDIPPALRNLIEDMMDRVEKKIGKEDADIANEALAKFKSGSDVMSQSEISSQINKLLRLLT